MNNVTAKQVVANQKNAKLGGVKSQKGKEIVRFNARKHGILSNLITDYEENIYKYFLDQLFEEYKPIGFMEEMLVERIAICYLRLFRAGKAEKEFMLSRLNPGEFKDELEIPDFTTCIKKPYKAIIKEDDLEKFSSTYLRYEISLENRLYKAIHELERVQRVRKGENVLAPIAVEVNGFVSQNNQSE